LEFVNEWVLEKRYKFQRNERKYRPSKEPVLQNFVGPPTNLMKGPPEKVKRNRRDTSRMGNDETSRVPRGGVQGPTVNKK